MDHFPGFVGKSGQDCRKAKHLKFYKPTASRRTKMLGYTFAFFEALFTTMQRHRKEEEFIFVISPTQNSELFKLETLPEDQRAQTSHRPDISTFNTHSSTLFETFVLSRRTSRPSCSISFLSCSKSCCLDWNMLISSPKTTQSRIPPQMSFSNVKINIRHVVSHKAQRSVGSSQASIFGLSICIAT